MEQTFEEYLKQARWDFAKVAEKYPVEKNLELRTSIDSLLIAYDQAVNQALSLGAVVGRSEQLLAFKEWERDKCKLPWDAEPKEIVEQYLSQ